jgi:hypothetical protein
MRAFLLTVVTLLLALTALAATVSAKEPSPSQPPPPPPPPYQVIVHPRNPVTRVDRTFLQDAFLKNVKRWPSDSTIYPVDLVSSSNARRRFSEEVLGRSVSAVKSYWQQRIFSGRDVPPPELDSDDKIVAYVLKHEGAVGYVSGTANLGGSKLVSLGR